MKRYSMTIALAVLTFASLSQAWIKKGGSSDGTSAPPAPGVYGTQPSVYKCALGLYSNLGIYESSAEEACSGVRRDAYFQKCVIELTVTFDSVSRRDPSISEEDKYVLYAAKICNRSYSKDFGVCVSNLFANGGQYAEEGANLCRNGTNTQLNNCIVSEYASRGNAAVAAKICKEKYDPETRARVEAEKRRIEEQRRIEAERKAAEERRRQEEVRRQQEEKRKQDELKRKQEEQRRAEEQRRKDEETRNKDKGSVGSSTKQDDQRKQDELKRKQEEERRKQEEQKRKEEEERRKKEEEDKKKNEPVNPPLPTPLPSNGDDGVIVDLPMFE